MRSIWAAFMAIGLLASQEAGASSLIVMAPAEPATVTSIVYIGALPADYPPDASIITASHAASAPASARRRDASTRPARATAPAWPPAPSPSMIARGTPIPATPDDARPPRTAPRATALALPTVIRGGLVGDAFPNASNPAPAPEFAPPAAAPAPAMEQAPERPVTRRQQEREERREERRAPAPAAPPMTLPPPAAPTGVPL